MTKFKGNRSVELSVASALMYAARYEIPTDQASMGVQLRPPIPDRFLTLEVMAEINAETPVVANWWGRNDPQS